MSILSRALACQRCIPRRLMSTSSDPTWDHVFSQVKNAPPQIPSHSAVGPRRPRRQTMTAQEINAFNQVFNLIFDSMSEKSSPPPASVDIGGATGMGDLFGTLRRHSKRMKWTAQADEELDRKRDEMDLCNSDQELLHWAVHHVFGESQRYEQEFRDAKASAEPADLPMLQPPAYPHLIPLLMRTFRDKYRDPHLALSIFDYARHLSIASYVFGCSTNAYNELIATRWDCFRDLKGVHDALEEMFVNGVDMNNRTRELAEKVRKEVGERNLWMEDNQIGSSGVWEMLNNIERLAHRPAAGGRPHSSHQKSAPWNKWKTSEDTSNWEFDKW